MVGLRAVHIEVIHLSKVFMDAFLELAAKIVESMFIATRQPHYCDICITSPVYRVFRLVLYTSRLSSYSLTALGSVVLIQQKFHSKSPWI